jgi:hypothetical protein
MRQRRRRTSWRWPGFLTCHSPPAQPDRRRRPGTAAGAGGRSVRALWTIREFLRGPRRPATHPPGGSSGTAPSPTYELPDHRDDPLQFPTAVVAERLRAGYAGADDLGPAQPGCWSCRPWRLRRCSPGSGETTGCIAATGEAATPTRATAFFGVASPRRWPPATRRRRPAQATRPRVAARGRHGAACRVAGRNPPACQRRACKVSRRPLEERCAGPPRNHQPSVTRPGCCTARWCGP